MNLLTLIIGFLIASSLHDLVNFLSRMIGNRIAFNRLVKKMRAEVDSLVITKTQMGDKSILQPVDDVELEVPPSIIEKKIVKH